MPKFGHYKVLLQCFKVLNFIFVFEKKILKRNLEIDNHSYYPPPKSSPLSNQQEYSQQQELLYINV